jgi:hypothetical protein
MSARATAFWTAGRRWTGWGWWAASRASGKDQPGHAADRSDQPDPGHVQPSGENALLTGDNTALPTLDFIESPENIRPGDRVVSSGDGGVFPPGLLVGQVAQASDGRLRVRLAADYGRLEFLRVLRSHPAERLEDGGALILPPEPGLIGPQLPPAPAARPAGRGRVRARP